MKENNIFMNLVNMIITIGFITCLSFGAYYFCNWYGCNSFRSFLYLDIISWLESKIYDKPIELIIKEKAKHLNKKVKHSISHL